MKKLIIVSALLSAFPGLSSLVLADDMMAKENDDEMMNMHDTNKDGKLSKEEFTNEKMKAFTKYDKNSDNMLSKEEHKKMAMDMHDKMMGDEHMKS
jgi:Ca2+-binding EF-hand superfamily protein